MNFFYERIYKLKKSFFIVKKIESKSISKLNININKEDSNINDFLYAWSQFDSRPNRLTIYNSYSSTLFNEVVLSEFLEKNVHTEIIPVEECSIINDQYSIRLKDNIFISYIVVDRNNENSSINEIIFYYKSDEDYDDIVNIIKKLDDCIISFEDDDGNKLNTLTLNQNNLEIEPLFFNHELENTELFYNDKTYTKIDKLIKSIKKSTKGLSVLYGKRGTGKTSIINYLSSKLDRIVIFIPNNLIEQTINNAEFRKFLKKHNKPILVIDDCEMLFNEVFAKSNIFVNNLLQLVEGFLSDNTEVNVISIFNVDDIEEIDHSLLDCNNLLDTIEFNLLTDTESSELSGHLGNSKKYKQKNRLIDVIKNKNTKLQQNIGF